MLKKRRFNRIIKGIQKVKIQGARNIAKAAVKAYHMYPSKTTINQLIKLRPTEPMLVNTLNFLSKKERTYREVLAHFDESQEQINKHVSKLIKSNSIIFTHCHSTNVVNALIYAHKKGKNFQVYNTETRPLHQGRKTAKELSKAGIKITMTTDAAALDSIDKSDILFFGSDAILRNGDVINKIGSVMYARLAYENKTPLYIIADSWKFSPKTVKIEERSFHEIWENIPKRIKIKNPAFARIPGKYIKAIVSEYGILSPKQFVKKADKVI